MKRRAVFKVNGKVLYDSDFRDDDIEILTTEDIDIADELRWHGKPSEIASVTITMEVIDPR